MLLTEVTVAFILTSQDRPKSAPDPRLKISKRTSKFQSFLLYTALKLLFEKNLTTPKKIERMDPMGFFYTRSVGKPKKIEVGTFWGNFGNAKTKLRGETHLSRSALYVMREIFWFCSLGQQVKLEIL